MIRVIAKSQIGRTGAVRRKGAPRRGERGYAILLVLFLATLMLLGTMSVAPNILTEGRRVKEAEMIWRGKQYARGVKLYYRKTGKFPNTLDDLIKPKLGNVRFMRQAYKDPMNPKDGEWRLIYVSPTGQLIGSLKPGQTLHLNGLGAPAGLPGTSAAQVSAQSSSFGQSLGQAVGQVFGNSGSPNAGAGANPNITPPAGGASTDNSNNAGNSAGTSGVPGDAGNNSANDPANDAANDALLNSDSPTVIGGNIIGVGSKINQRSITVYEKAKNYKQFEFIWDPSKDGLGVGAPGQQLGPQIGTPAGQPGNNPFGSPGNPGTGFGGSGTPLNPPPSPPETAPNPQPPPQT